MPIVTILHLSKMGHHRRTIVIIEEHSNGRCIVYYDDSQANHHTHCEWSAVTATDLVGKLLSFANIYIEREKEREPSALSQNWSETIIIINWIKCNEYNEWIVCQPLLDGHIVLLFT